MRGVNRGIWFGSVGIGFVIVLPALLIFLAHPVKEHLAILFLAILGFGGILVLFRERR
jgi:hypothetical protein